MTFCGWLERKTDWSELWSSSSFMLCLACLFLGKSLLVVYSSSGWASSCLCNNANLDSLSSAQSGCANGWKKLQATAKWRFQICAQCWGACRSAWRPLDIFDLSWVQSTHGWRRWEVTIFALFQKPSYWSWSFSQGHLKGKGALLLFNPCHIPKENYSEPMLVQVEMRSGLAVGHWTTLTPNSADGSQNVWMLKNLRGWEMMANRFV